MFMIKNRICKSQKKKLSIWFLTNVVDRTRMNISNEDCQQVQWRNPSLAGWVGRLIRASHPSDTPLAYWPNTSQEQSILSVTECAPSNIDQIYTVWLLFPLKYMYVCNRQQTEEPKMISTCGVIDVLIDRTRIHNNDLSWNLPFRSFFSQMAFPPWYQHERFFRRCFMLTLKLTFMLTLAVTP